MFDKYYDDEIKEILIIAKEEAMELKYTYIGTEVVMLGLLRNKKIKKIFNKNITYDKFKEKLIELVGIGEKNNSLNLFTPMLKRILEATANEAKETNALATPLVLLKNILIEGNGVGYRVLTFYDINTDDLFKDVIKNINKQEKELICNEKKNKEENFYDNCSNNLEEEIKLNMGERNNMDMNYNFYDFIAATSRNERLRVRNAKIVKVENEHFNDLINKKIELKKDFADNNIIKIEKLENGMRKSLPGTYVIIFISNDGKQNIGIFFEYKNDGTYVSKNKFTLTNEDFEDAIDLMEELKFSYKISNIVEKFKQSKNNFIYDTEKILNDYKCELEKQTSKMTKEKDIKNALDVLNKNNSLINLNEKVNKNETIIIGLEDEFKELIKGLMHMRKPNVMLLAKPGVGKTALVEKLAIELNKNNVPNLFKGYTIFELSMSNAVAGTKYRGEFEDKMKKIIEAAKKAEKVILFIDEAHTLIGAGGADGAIDASNILKPYMARGDIKIIGATTLDEYKKYIEKDGAIKRRFNNITIEEPTRENVNKIIFGLKEKLEKFYSLTIPNEIMDNCYDNAKKRAGSFPDIAIDELEDYCIKESVDNFLEEGNKEKEMA